MALLNFYLITLIIVALTFVIAIVKRQKELIRRSATLLVLIHILCAILWMGQTAFLIFVLVLVATGAFELARCSEMTAIKRILMVAASILLFTLCKSSGLALCLFLLLGLITAILLLIPKNIITNRTVITWTSLTGIVVPCGVAMTLIYDVDLKHIIALILLVQFNDAFAYLGGKILGKTKPGFIRAISPNKTIEGYIAGMVAVIPAVLLLQTVIPVYPATGILMRILLLFVSVLVFANAGDLTFSAIKRRLNVKDFSNLLAGHGGILDRFDSILFLSPVYLLLLYAGAL
jgi:phosphatidate cytidylyltransferase